MGGKTGHEGKCPVCGRVGIKELCYDVKSDRLMCQVCYDVAKKR